MVHCSDDLLNIPPLRTDLCSSNSYAIAVRIYNNMPEGVKELTIGKFKGQLFDCYVTIVFILSKNILNTKVDLFISFTAFQLVNVLFLL